MTRRGLIKRLFLILGAGPLGLFGCLSRRTPPATPLSVKPSLVPSESGALSAAEIEDLVAFGEILVEGRTLAPTERRQLVEHIKERAGRSTDYLSLYRTAASMLDRVAERRFASLEVRERIDMIARHRLAPGLSPGEQLSDEMRVLRMRAVPELIRGYYGSPAGWAVVGYHTFPGRCGDLTRYTRPEP